MITTLLRKLGADIHEPMPGHTPEEAAYLRGWSDHARSTASHIRLELALHELRASDVDTLHTARGDA